MRNLKENKFKVEEYDEFYSHHYFEPFKDEDAINAHTILPRVGWALDIAREIGAKTVLDLGCLEGYCILTLAQNAGCRGVGVDLSEDGVNIGNERAKKYKLPVEFIQGTLEDYLQKTLDDGTKYDLITLFEVMEHVKDPELVFKLAFKCLSKKGEILVSTPEFESPTYGMTDTINKCHIRLFSVKDKDYQATFEDKHPTSDTYGQQVTRTATSLPHMVGKNRIKSIDIWSELLHARLK